MQKTKAKRTVGAILCCMHIHKYVEEQNRETSVVARIFKSQQEATAQCEIKEKVPFWSFEKYSGVKHRDEFQSAKGIQKI